MHVCEGESVFEEDTVGLRDCVEVDVVDGDAVLVVEIVGVDDKETVAESVALVVEVGVDDGERELEMLRDGVTVILGVVELDNVGVSVGVDVTEWVDVCDREVEGVAVGEEDGELLIDELVVDEDVGVTEDDNVRVIV